MFTIRIKLCWGKNKLKSRVTLYHQGSKQCFGLHQTFRESFAEGMSFAKKIIEKSNEVPGSGGWGTILEERLINVPLVERWVCNGPQRGWARAS